MSRADQDTAAARYLRKMSHGVAGADTGAVEAATQEAISPERLDEVLKRALERIKQETGREVDPTLKADFERLIRSDGKSALERLKSQGLSATLAPAEQDALEAIVETDGSRPTIALSSEDKVNVDDEMLRQWRQPTKEFADQVSRVAKAVGRIDLDEVHKGTGFVVGDTLILTNRHVLQELATVDAAGRWAFRGAPTITFDANPGQSRERQFKIVRVVSTGAKAIDPWNPDHSKLDFAVLECEVSGDAGGFASPLSLESDADKVFKGRPVFLVGYPAAPRSGTYSTDLLQQLFAHRYGVKRFSPGEIDRGFGSAAEGEGETVFAHDATTLGGSSGSCVVDFGNDGRLVVGLHFAGAPKVTNYAHSNACLRPALGEAGLTWKAWLPKGGG